MASTSIPSPYHAEKRTSAGAGNDQVPPLTVSGIWRQEENTRSTATASTVVEPAIVGFSGLADNKPNRRSGRNTAFTVVFNLSPTPKCRSFAPIGI
ncbi:MAG: hypothetical protein GY753_19625, partial [Gammaproteobacteria bacterium]|nr:hypothetical protein [Gammaproteobacteria bacterium]